MNSHKKSFLFSFAAVTLSLLPAFALVALAQNGGGPSNLCDGGICNPLGETNDLGALILKIVEGIAQVGYYLVVLFIIYSGFKFVKARGNEKELADAKQTFLYTVIGAAILLGATLLAKVIDGTVNELKTADAQHEASHFNV